MKDKKGILFVINDLRPGGAEMFVLRLAKYLSAYFNIYIFCLNPENNDKSLIKLFHENLNFEFINEKPLYISPTRQKIYWKLNALGNIFGKKGIYNKLIHRRNNKNLKTQFIKNKITAITSSGFSSDYKSVFYFKKHFNIPVLITMHSSYNPENWHKYYSDETKFINESNKIFKNADAIFYTADQNVEIFKKFINYSGHKPEKIYLGFEPESASNIRDKYVIPENAFVVCMMARGIEEKGWKEAIDSFIKLKEIYSNSYFFIISTITEYIEKLKTEYSNQKNLIFTGFQSNPAAFLNSSSCSILPTYYPESLPYAITESLACNLPVLATPVAEIPNMLNSEKGIAGELIPFDENNRANVNILADFLIKLATDQTYYEEKKTLAKLAFEKFSMKKCGDAYLQKLIQIN